MACSCVMKYYSADLSEMRDPPILLDSIRESSDKKRTIIDIHVVMYII